MESLIRASCVNFRFCKRIALLVLVLCFAHPLTVSAQSDLTGFWVFRVPTSDGNFRETFLDLKQENENITGKLLSGTREIPIADGTFKEGKLHFVTRTTSGDQVRQTVYEGTLNGDKFEMSSQVPGREPMKGTAERTKPEAALPPARLPLPELHDVKDNGLVRTPPMGWNSWNKFAGKIDDATVRQIADAMVSSGMKDAGYIYVNIDDTWEAAKRDPQGNIATNPK